MTDLPTLDVVVPVFDEAPRIEQSLRSLRTALDASPWAQARVVVIDDGSTDGTGRLLDRLAPQLDLHVVHQENRGRLLARARGLQESEAQLVLLVDARVTVHPGALAYLADELRRDDTAVIWNGYVTVDSAGNPYAAFWSALTTLGWRRYFAHRRSVSYGEADFDSYPKGTGFFVAPRLWLIEESASLDSRYADARFSSDDTALIRALVRRADINLAPEFSCTYRGRDSLRSFVNHAAFRGTTFVDSYVGRSGRVGTGATLAALLAPVLAVVGLRRPRSTVAAGVVGALSLGGAARASGAPAREAIALAGLLPVFGVAFGAGFARGLVLALRAAAQRRR
jgi:glycosyltransferase involved in cell wall biosynthesis